MDVGVVGFATEANINEIVETPTFRPLHENTSIGQTRNISAPMAATSLQSWDSGSKGGELTSFKPCMAKENEYQSTSVIL